MALGNVIGSNIFNLLAIMGVTVMFGPVPVVFPFLAFDLWAMLGASLLLIPFVFSRKRDLTRRWGFGLSVLYVAYLIMVVLHG